jgi:hypothetical protein
VPEEEEVKDRRNDQTQSRDNPNDQGEQHGEVDDSLLLVSSVDHELDIHKKLLEVGAIFCRVIANRYELRLHDGVQSHGVESNSRSLGNNDEQRALELEIDKEGDVVGTLLTLGQLCEDQEAAPALAGLGDAHTLQYSCQGLEVAFRDTSGPHDAQSPDPSVCEKDVGDDDGNGEDPFGNVKGHGRFDLAGPFVKSKEVDGGEGIGSIDCA